MKLFSKTNHSHLVSSFSSHLAGGTSVEGTLSTDDDIFLDCEFVGNITTNGLIEVGTNALIKATINARSIIIEGKTSGEVTAKEQVSIGTSAIVDGSLKSRQIEIRPGAVVNATLETKV